MGLLRDIVRTAVKARQTAEGLSDVEVCRRAKVNARTVNRLENGSNLTAESLESLLVWALNPNQSVEIVTSHPSATPAAAA